MSVFIWTMIGVAVWHFTIFVPDRWAGGIIGAFLAAWLGGLFAGLAVEGFSIPTDNPPGLVHVIWALPGSLLGLAICWLIGDKHLRRNPHLDPASSTTHPPGHAVAQPQTQEVT